MHPVAGISLERLAHATIAITMDTYSHLITSMQGEVNAKLAKLRG